MILKEIGAQPRRAPAQFKPRLYCWCIVPLVFLITIVHNFVQ